MVVDVTGFGWSGSGAVIDLLKEYDELQYSKTFSGELSLLHNVDGIRDLEYKLCQKKGHVLDADIAVKRFFHLIDKYYDKDKAFNGKLSLIVRDYITKLGGIEYLSRSGYDKTYFYTNKLILSAAYNKIVKHLTGGKYEKKLRIDNMNMKYLIVNPDNFVSATQEFVQSVLRIIRDESELPLITDHLFPPIHPEEYFKYAGEYAKCVIVWRDPRDTYILAKAVYGGKIPVPCDSVESFCWYYKRKIEETRQTDSDNVMTLRFEDFIYNYEKARKRLEDFLQIAKHSRQKIFFKPEKSIANTRLYQRYTEYEKDINYIQSTLKESLFPFEAYSQKNDGKAAIF